MSGVQRFEDLLAWQKARTLTSEIYGLTRKGELARDYGLKDQMQRAAVSIKSNNAEGFERRSRRNFRHFLVIAKASCVELRSQLYVALDAGMISQPQFDTMTARAVEVSRILSGLHNSIRVEKKA